MSLGLLSKLGAGGFEWNPPKASFKFEPIGYGAFNDETDVNLYVARKMRKRLADADAKRTKEGISEPDAEFIGISNWLGEQAVKDAAKSRNKQFTDTFKRWMLGKVTGLNDLSTTPWGHQSLFVT